MIRMAKSTGQKWVKLYENTCTSKGDYSNWKFMVTFSEKVNFKVNGYTLRGSNFAVFILYPFLIFGVGDATVKGKNLLPKEEGDKFLHLRADPFWKCSVAHGSNQEVTEVASFRKGDGNIHLGN